MPKSLLAVDDSVTMRKVVEMTFAGEDLHVTTAATAADALAAIRKNRPDIVLADVSLEGTTGYDLCRSIKDEFKTVPVVVISSKQNPWDPARGQASGADEHFDKPWDTGKLIELVKKVLAQGKSVAPAPIAAAAAAPAGIPASPPAPAFAAAPAAPAAPAIAMPPRLSPSSSNTLAGMPAVSGTPTPAATPAAKPLAPPAASPISIPKPVTPAAPAVAPKPVEPIVMPRPQTPAAPPVVAKPAPAPAAAPAAAPVPEVVHGTLAELAQHSGNGHAPVSAELAGKLHEIGLTPAQVDAVLALSREVVERVVWEVVPVLAETMVREEIARLTREG